MADDNDPDGDRDTQRTTIITTDGGGRGSGGLIIAVLLVLILLAVLFFAGVFDRDDESELNLDVNTPPNINVNLPETTLPPVVVAPQGQTPPPDVNVNVTTPPPEANDLNQVNSL